MASATCPHCDQRIHNPSPAADGKVRCLNCGESFEFIPEGTGLSLAETSGAAAPMAFEQLRTNEPVPQSPFQLTADPDPSRNPSPQAPPLGREPSPTSYVLLTALAWGYVGLCGFNFVNLIMFLLSNRNRWDLTPDLPTMLLSLFSRTSRLLPVANILSSLTQILAAIGLICFFKTLVQLDNRAAWISWRAGVQSPPSGAPPGSSLPYILPWTVCGGIAVIMGLDLAGDFASAENLTLPSGYTLLLYGFMIALTGIAFGELRRWLWRMTQFAKGLPARRRGHELNIGAPVYPRAISALSYAPVLFRGAVITASVFFCAAAFVELSSPRSRGNDLLLLLALGTLIVGGGYSALQLNHGWAEMQCAWRAAAASVNNCPAPASSQSAALFQWLTWVLAASAIALFFYILSESNMGIEAVPFLASVIFAVFYLLWLGKFRLDADQYSNALAVLGKWKTRRPLGLPRGMAIALQVMAGLTVCVCLLTIWPNLRSGMRGLLESFMFILFNVLLLSLFFLPFFLFGTVVNDAAHALSCLEACDEVAPEAPNSTSPQ